jgi:RNase adapter protein RapZ
LLDPIRNVADTLIDTSNFNVHELRADVLDRFGHEKQTKRLLVSCLSFGFKNGVPLDADMVFDVRFLPNPHFVPEFRKKTGLDPKVAAYVRGFPQTREFLNRVTKLMLYLLPHYVEEGKSYLTVAFGCTGGQHRSVMMAEELRQAPPQSRLPGQGPASRHGALSKGIQSVRRKNVSALEYQLHFANPAYSNPEKIERERL